jgi:hypothetical protein
MGINMPDCYLIVILYTIIIFYYLVSWTGIIFNDYLKIIIMGLNFEEIETIEITEG